MVRIDLVFVAVLALFAQLPAAIHGVLTDASGAVIPGAAVSLSGANVRTTAQTAADGSYSFQGLAAGDYTVFVKATGLEVLEKRITVESGKTAQLVITLRPEVLTQALTVTEEPETDVGVESDKSASAVVIKTTELDTLPDNPDDLLSILQTLAGQAGGGAQILVDNFSGGQLPSKSTIKEIKINQDPFSAAYDWMGFGRIEIVTKPGGDKLHGTFGLTDNDAALNSRNPYAANKADYVNRIITANIGSSFGKRASYGLDAYHSTINNTALINAVTLDPATFAETPVRKTVVVPRDDISGTGRLDLQMSASHTLTGSYRYLRIDRNNNGVGGYSLESRGYPSKITNNELRLTETATLNANAVMDTRFGYTANGNYQYGATSIPSLIVSSAFNGGSAQTGATRHQTHYFEFQNNVSVSHGAHALKFGGRFRYIPTTDISPSNFGGTFSFFGMTNAPVLDTNNQPVGNETTQISSLEQYRRTLLLQGLGYSGTAIRNLGGGASQFSTAAGNPEVDFTQTDFTFYGLDDWRVRQDVTVSLGLRYMTQDVVRDWHGAQPRIAVAWSASPKTVVRAGWGSFYQTIDWPLIQQARRFNGLTEQQYVVTNPDFFPLLPPINSLAVAQSQTTYRLASHFRSDPWMLAAISFDRQLPGKNSISLSYRDQRTTHIPQTVNINAPMPGGERPYGGAAGNIFEFQPGGIQKVKWLTVQANNKLGQRLSLTTNYSYMTAYNHGGYTDGGRWESAIVSNPYNLNQDWGRAGWLNNHNFSLIGTVSAPKGLQFSPLLVAYSGKPYDLTIGSDVNGDTVANDRPAFATDLSRPSVVQTKFGAFDTNPLPGQKIVPRNYLTTPPMWNLIMRISKTFTLPKEAHLNFNIEADNVFNHVNHGGFVGNLSSPLFGQSTALFLYRDTSNNRRVQFGTQFTF